MEIWLAILHFDQSLHALVMQHAGLAYGILFGVVFLQIGVLPFFFLPSNPFLFVCGTLCAAGDLKLGWVLALLILAAWLGSLLAYWLGATVGHGFFVQKLGWPKQQTLDKTHAFYAKHGALGLVFSNFLPVIRTLAPFVAGMTRMQFGTYLKSVSAGAIVWVLACVLAGYFFGNIPIVQNHLGAFMVGGLGLVMLVFLASRLFKSIKKR